MWKIIWESDISKYNISPDVSEIHYICVACFCPCHFSGMKCMSLVYSKIIKLVVIFPQVVFSVKNRNYVKLLNLSFTLEHLKYCPFFLNIFSAFYSSYTSNTLFDSIYRECLNSSSMEIQYDFIPVKKDATNDKALTSVPALLLDC